MSTASVSVLKITQGETDVPSFWLGRRPPPRCLLHVVLTSCSATNGFLQEEWAIISILLLCGESYFLLKFALVDDRKCNRALMITTYCANPEPEAVWGCFLTGGNNRSFCFTNVLNFRWTLRVSCSFCFRWIVNRRCTHLFWYLFSWVSSFLYNTVVPKVWGGEHSAGQIIFFFLLRISVFRN